MNVFVVFVIVNTQNTL